MAQRKPPSGNGWEEWKQHVLLEMNRLATGDEKILKRLSKIEIDIATLKVKSGVWGLVGGLLAVGIAVLVRWPF